MRYLLFIILFASCTTQEKVTKWNDAHKLEAAKYCAEKFPVTSYDTIVELKVIDSTKYKEAEIRLIMAYDTIIKHRDSFRTIIKRVLKPCLDTPKVTIRVVTDSAKIYTMIQNEMTLKETLQRLKEGKDFWRKLAIITIAIALIYIIVKSNV